MVTKSNIVQIINKYQEEIDELRADLINIYSKNSRRIIENRISYLEDNMYRYKLQAKAWGIEV